MRSRPPDYLGPVPYGLGLVEFENGLRLTSVLLADDLDALHIGDPVHLVTLEIEEGPAYVTFAFRRTPSDGGGVHA